MNVNMMKGSFGLASSGSFSMGESMGEGFSAAQANSIFIFKPDASMPVFSSSMPESPGVPQAVAPPILPVVASPYVAPVSDEPEIPVYEQSGQVSLGPGAQKEAPLLGLGLSKLGSRAQDDLSKAKKYAMEQSIKFVLMKQTLQHQQQQQKVAMYAQALSLMSRVYIGSISFELREETIKNAFSPFGPIKSINMSWDPITGHHKGFAFLEYEVPEAAMLGQEQMNGVLIGGRNIKVGRPSNMPQAQPIIDAITEEAKKFNRVYISSVHPDLTETDLKSVFEAFGRIVSCQLAKSGPNNKHKGFGYLEYDSPQSAADAVASMNLFDLGGQYLRVGRAITPPQAQTYLTPSTGGTLPTAAAVAAAAATAKIQAMEATSETQRVPGGLSSAPKVIVSGQTVPDLQGFGDGPIFTVPQPGLAIPQLPSQPQLVTMTPQLYSTPSPGVQSSSNSPSLYSAEANGDSKGGATAFGGESVSAPSMVAAPADSSFPSRYSLIAPPSQNSYSMSGVVNMDSNSPAKSGAPATVQDQSSTKPVQPQLKSDDAVTEKLLLNPTLSDKQRQLIESEAAQSLAAQEDMKIKGNEARNILMHKLMRRTESCILVLKNMVGPEDIDEFLEQEILDECSNFGQVQQVLIYQERQGAAANAPVVVKIFVRFSLSQEVERAKKSLDGRFFAGRTVKAEVYDQHMFDANDLSH